MERLAALNDTKPLLGLVPGARWARGKEVVPVLASLCNHPDETLRRQAVEALGWRLRKRGAGPDALLRALGHRDPATQLLAAEALKAGRAEGLSVLLASIDFISDLAMRRRAVLGLGELADERALDPLLRLAAEEGHALQEPAAVAIHALRRRHDLQPARRPRRPAPPRDASGLGPPDRRGRGVRHPSREDGRLASRREAADHRAGRQRRRRAPRPPRAQATAPRGRPQPRPRQSFRVGRPGRDPRRLGPPTSA